MKALANISKLEETWLAFEREVNINFSEPLSEYDKLEMLLDNLLDITGDNNKHPLRGLLSIVANAVEQVDGVEYKAPNVKPYQALDYFMNEHGLKPYDLEYLVTQNNLNRILKGEMSISLNLAKKLAHLFHVEQSVFLN